MSRAPIPHTPGIDAAGIVVASAVDSLHPGDEVIVIGHDLGMNTSGGFGQYIRVPAAWVIPRPPALSLHTAMVYGTAGFTAALALQRLVAAGLAPDAGEVLVTGATGGVGSFAVAFLAQAGFNVVAATGKPTNMVTCATSARPRYSTAAPWTTLPDAHYCGHVGPRPSTT